MTTVYEAQVFSTQGEVIGTFHTHVHEGQRGWIHVEMYDLQSSTAFAVTVDEAKGIIKALQYAIDDSINGNG